MRVAAIRNAVYIGEQECPYEEEYDGNDQGWRQALSRICVANVWPQTAELWVNELHQATAEPASLGIHEGPGAVISQRSSIGGSFTAHGVQHVRRNLLYALFSVFRQNSVHGCLRCRQIA